MRQASLAASCGQTHSSSEAIITAGHSGEPGDALPTPPTPRARPPFAAGCRRALRLEPRFHVVLACFLAALVAYVERVGFSIAFTAMCNQAGVEEGHKGVVLSAFYWGYAVSQVGHSLVINDE